MNFKGTKSQRSDLCEISDDILTCTKCDLHQTRRRVVPGQGSASAQIVFIGEAPGKKEDELGIPFCGAAGRFLDELLGLIKLDRDKVFITNTIKCRPPNNRDPKEGEKLACKAYLRNQLDIISPKVVVTLGNHAKNSVLPEAEAISKAHGKVIRGSDGRMYLPLYHPAAALYNGSLREVQKKDFMQIPKVLKNIKKINIKINLN